MNVTREVIVDLLPVYLSGEASPATRALVEEYVKQDAELAQRIRLQQAENFSNALSPALPAELELKTLRRTKTLLAWQKWLLGFGISFSATVFVNHSTFQNGRLTEFHFLLRNPVDLGVCAAIALACWIAYFAIRRRLRTSKL
jgi:anti-sigma factor RsiW